MDYKGQVCPVCKKPFEKADDVVVCPVCGTPHHRDCYDSIGDCFNANRHRENYDYQREQEVNAPDTDNLICPFCGNSNPADSRFCNSCGKPFIQSNSYASSESNSDVPPGGAAPQGRPGNTFVMFDPLGGVKAEEKIADNITAGEAAKLVKNSTPYFIPQFKQLYNRNKTRFSFVGFIFAGGWMLYRKMYKLGVLFTTLWGLILLAQTYITVYYADFINQTIDSYYSLFRESVFSLEGYTNIYTELFGSMTNEQLWIFFGYAGLSVVTVLMRLICGIFGNRWYYKHCVKTIGKVKASETSPEEISKKLNLKGGVNVGLAVSLIASYYILTYLPVFL